MSITGDALTLGGGGIKRIQRGTFGLKDILASMGINVDTDATIADIVNRVVDGTLTPLSLAQTELNNYLSLKGADDFFVARAYQSGSTGFISIGFNTVGSYYNRELPLDPDWECKFVDIPLAYSINPDKTVVEITGGKADYQNVSNNQDMRFEPYLLESVSAEKITVRIQGPRAVQGDAGIILAAYYDSAWHSFTPSVVNHMSFFTDIVYQVVEYE